MKKLGKGFADGSDISDRSHAGLDVAEHQKNGKIKRQTDNHVQLNSIYYFNVYTTHAENALDNS
jgi:hypothetical protein